jgi:HNH endonuclease
MEHWRIAPGTHAMVSTEGRVWDRTFLEPWRSEDDEVLVLIEGRVRVLAHLVLLAFTGDRPARCEAQHKDGDTTNNALANLTWRARARPPQLALVERRPLPFRRAG